MSSMASTERVDDPQSERQVAWFSELRRLYRGIPASLAGASAILCNRRSHFDLLRADSALFGINPIPGSAIPMLSCRRAMRPRGVVPACPRHDARAKLHRCRTEAASLRLSLDRARRRLSAIIGNAWTKLYAIIGGYRCPVTAPW